MGLGNVNGGRKWSTVGREWYTLLEENRGCSNCFLAGTNNL